MKKYCSGCRTDLPLSGFNNRTDGSANKTCKACTKRLQAVRIAKMDNGDPVIWRLFKSWGRAYE